MNIRDSNRVSTRKSGLQGIARSTIAPCKCVSFSPCRYIIRISSSNNNSSVTITNDIVARERNNRNRSHTK